VEPGTATGQVWDTEAFVLTSLIDDAGIAPTVYDLSMVGGWDFLNGRGSWRSGDLFVDVDGDAIWGEPGIGGGDTGLTTELNQWGYDYVYDVNWGASTWDLYRIDAADTLLEVYYGINEESNPWRYHSGGTSIATGGAVASASGDDAWTNTLVDSGVGFLGGQHYSVTVDLDWIIYDMYLLNGGPIEDPVQFITHFTEECGNDNLMGVFEVVIDRPPDVPEPSTLVLLGVGIGGVLMRRRLRNLF
jgi:hypothetical protein